MDKNDITTPFALFKAGMIYLIDGNKDKALAAFKQIQDEFPQSTEWNEIDKYITLAENL